MWVLRSPASSYVSLDDAELGVGFTAGVFGTVRFPEARVLLPPERQIAWRRLHLLPQLHQQLPAIAGGQVAQEVLGGQLHQPAQKTGKDPDEKVVELVRKPKKKLQIHLWEAVSVLGGTFPDQEIWKLSAAGISAIL